MFEGFQSAPDTGARRRFVVSTGIAAAVCVVLAAFLVAVGTGHVRPPKPEPVEVVFHKPKPAPKPKPVLKTQKPPPRPKKARAAQSGARAKGPSPTPQAIPEGQLAEGDASDFSAGAGIGIDWTEPGGSGLGGGAISGSAMAAPPPPPPSSSSLASGKAAAKAVPPKPKPSNPRPRYPDEMRRRGVEGVVVFRVLVDETGAVTDVRVLEGDEPFVSAAKEVVASWSYEPAERAGRAVSAHRIIRVPFRLRS